MKRRRKYKIDDRVFSIIVYLEGFVLGRPSEYSKEIYNATDEYTKKLREIIGIEEEKYKEWDIDDIKCELTYTFKK